MYPPFFSLFKLMFMLFPDADADDDVVDVDADVVDILLVDVNAEAERDLTHLPFFSILIQTSFLFLQTYFVDIQCLCRTVLLTFSVALFCFNFCFTFLLHCSVSPSASLFCFTSSYPFVSPQGCCYRRPLEEQLEGRTVERHKMFTLSIRNW